MVVVKQDVKNNVTKKKMKPNSKEIKNNNDTVPTYIHTNISLFTNIRMHIR